MQLAEAWEQLLGFPEKMQLVSSSAVTSSWSWARWPELTWHTFILYALPKPLLGAPCWGVTERGRRAHGPEEETPGHSRLLPGEWGKEDRQEMACPAGEGGGLGQGERGVPPGAVVLGIECAAPMG